MVRVDAEGAELIARGQPGSSCWQKAVPLHVRVGSPRAADCRLVGGATRRRSDLLESEAHDVSEQ